MKRAYIGIIIFSFLYLPVSFAYAESGSGFLNNTIWYSKADFKEGDTVEIHTAIWNAESSTLQAVVEFTDKNVILGFRSVSIPSHTLSDVFITWKVTSGKHTIKANIKDTSLKINGAVTPITLADKEQSLPELFIPKTIKTNTGDTLDVGKVVNEKVNAILPEDVAKPVSKGIVGIDDFRTNTAGTVASLLEKTENRIEEIKAKENLESTEETKSTTVDKIENKESANKTQVIPQTATNSSSKIKPTDDKKSTVKSTSVKSEPEKPLSGTEKPIAYIEKFLLSVALFILSKSIVFYLIFLFLVFIILRFIYRKIRGK